MSLCFMVKEARYEKFGGIGNLGCLDRGNGVKIRFNNNRKICFQPFLF
jgi:hypothetical protein